MKKSKKKSAKKSKQKSVKKSMDAKLSKIKKDKSSNEFIICYAADPDMGGGINAIVNDFDSLEHYQSHLENMVKAGDIDILLASVSTMDHVARKKRLFDGSHITAAIRANDTTDVWGIRGGSYTSHAALPFATTTVSEAMYGTLTPKAGQTPDVDLGLYSMTFNNNLETDYMMLEHFKKFRSKAVKQGFRYFLEVFNPNDKGSGVSDSDVGNFVNDHISRLMAGIPDASRPEFIKMPYNGPKAMEDLVKYNSVVVGVLGGPASTSFDTFKLLHESKKYGARLALFGRRIKGVEEPVVFTKLLRKVADGKLSPKDATTAYHDALVDKGIKAQRSFADDMVIHTPALKL